MRQRVYVSFAALAVIACPVVAVLGSNSEAMIIPAYVAFVFASFAGLARLTKKKERLARALAWLVRVFSIPFLLGFLWAAFLLSPINNKLYVDFTRFDWIWSRIWNALLVVVAVALWWLLHSELKRVTRNEERG